MRKLATIREIKNLTPIKGADRIELAHIDGWKVVVGKDVKHKIGDKVVYCEIDSFLPIEPEFEFLRKSSYKKLVDDTEGYRLRTIRLRNQISQGLIIPFIDAQKIINRKKGSFNVENLNIGDDVTSLLGIVKYEPPIPANLSGTVKGRFPSFIQKTDEERCQNLVDEINQWSKDSIKHEFYITEKLDGSSFTCYYNEGEFGVCSRNMELKPDKDNTLWKVAIELDLENKLKSFGKNIALQGELIGEGIQKNRYKIKGHTVRFFNVFDIDNFCKKSHEEFNKIIENFNLQSVPQTVAPGYKLPSEVDDLLLMAESKSIMNPMAEREGVVIRSKDNKISFKVISNKFLSK